MQGALPSPASLPQETDVFDVLNLDDYGGESFDPHNVNHLYSYGNRLVRRKFELERSWSDKERAPFVWRDRMGDWRRLERLYNLADGKHQEAWAAYWHYAEELWKRTRKICGKRAQSYYIQFLPPMCKRSKGEKPYFHQVQESRDVWARSKSKISMTSCSDTTKIDPQDAKHVWIWLGSAEEEEFNRLRRRAEQLRRYSGLAWRAMIEAITVRLHAWNKANADNPYFYEKKRFVSIRCNGRSYGFLIGAGGVDPVWAPPQKPPMFL